MDLAASGGEGGGWMVFSTHPTWDEGEGMRRGPGAVDKRRIGGREDDDVEQCMQGRR